MMSPIFYYSVVCFLCLSFSLLAATDWIILANSPHVSMDQIRESVQERHIVALDGVINKLKHSAVRPHVILGDFDSLEDREYWGIRETFDEIDENSQPYIGNFGILIVPMKNQDLTDLEKGILYCDEQGARSILIINAVGGGRMDHTLGNIGVLRKYHRTDRKLWIETETESVEFIKDASTTISGEVGDHCAVMGYPEAFMTTTGLKYNGSRYPLKLGIQESVCNTLDAKEAFVEIEGEALVIGPKG